MADLAIITPSRGRPARFAEMVAAVDATASGSVEVLCGRDSDDPTEYLAALYGRTDVTAMSGERRSLSAWTNLLAERALSRLDPPRYLASLGDDHRPRTPRWDRTLIGAIEDRGGSGIAYGNDLLQGERLPTAWVMSADIVRALGWMMLPACHHMFVDNAILELGQALGLIAYCPDVVIEHMHPTAGKAAMDASYRASNHPQRTAEDGRAFAEWQAGSLPGDVARVRAALDLARTG